jgi:RHS repeat-associated protein
VVDNAGTPVLDWQYTTDAEGNVTNTLDGIDAANHRAYAYQDGQYFLTQGDGPWGDLSWTYDRIGNRLSETRGGVADAYVYVPNAAGGGSPALDHIDVGAGGQRIYQYDAAGNQTQVDTLGTTIERTHDDAGRMTLQNRPSDQVSASFSYDGRGFLRQVSQTTDAGGTALFCDGFESGDTSAWGVGGTACPALKSNPVYSTAGTLHARNQDLIFYFMGRPVAQLGENGPWILLTLDHLGSPILATDLAGNLTWQGGFEPFGADFADAEGVGVFLRLPGQWADPSWAVSDDGDSVSYNLHRWYQPGAGRYTRTDPATTPAIYQPQVYSYVAENPLRYIDPLGLFTVAGTCDGCIHPFLGPRIPRSRLNLTRFISKETSSWCQTQLGGITNIALRKCIEKSCREGIVRCSNGDLVAGDLCERGGGTPGFTARTGGDFGHWARRNGVLPQTRTAILCANSSVNFEGRAGGTVIHEWAHGCGWNPDKAPYPEGIPATEH